MTTNKWIEEKPKKSVLAVATPPETEIVFRADASCRNKTKKNLFIKELTKKHKLI